MKTNNLFKVLDNSNLIDQNIYALLIKKIESGSFRDCYKGEIKDKFGNFTTTNDFPTGECVVKIYRDPKYAQDFVKDFESSKVANEQAVYFNLKIGKPNKINYILPYATSININGIEERISIEPFLEGDFKKFYNNDGEEIEQEDGKRFNKHCSAFSHFTWLNFRGRMVVTDLQGVFKNGKYYLTDPACQSLEQSYGNSDLGAQGIIKFLLFHKCTSICKNWPLLNIKFLKNFLTTNDAASIKATKYSFETTKNEKYRPIYEGLLAKFNF